MFKAKADDKAGVINVLPRLLMKIKVLIIWYVNAEKRKQVTAELQEITAQTDLTISYLQTVNSSVDSLMQIYEGAKNRRWQILSKFITNRNTHSSIS